MRKKRLRPWWYRNVGPVLWLLALTGFLFLLVRAVVYLLRGCGFEKKKPDW